MLSSILDTRARHVIHEYWLQIGQLGNILKWLGLLDRLAGDAFNDRDCHGVLGGCGVDCAHMWHITLKTGAPTCGTLLINRSAHMWHIAHKTKVPTCGTLLMKPETATCGTLLIKPKSHMWHIAHETGDCHWVQGWVSVRWLIQTNN